MPQTTQYTEDNIRSLDWKEHIRMRPGMYIGKLGDGSSADDGIYILLKEVLDNSIDEFVMGAGKTIEIAVKEGQVTVRDYGRGIPLGKVVDVVSRMNTGGKYDTRAFKKSVGLNGVGTKAVNALSTYFKVESIRDDQSKVAVFERGELTEDPAQEPSSKRKGTSVSFVPDESIFKHFRYRHEYIVRMLKNYVYLNPGLTIVFNGEKYKSENGLKDLLEDNNNAEDMLYPIIHLRGNDIEVAMPFRLILRSNPFVMINQKLLSLSEESSQKTLHKNRAANAKVHLCLLCQTKAFLSTFDIVMSISFECSKTMCISIQD